MGEHSVFGKELRRHDMEKGKKYFCINRTTKKCEYNRFLGIGPSGGVIMRKQNVLVNRPNSDWAFYAEKTNVTFSDTVEYEDGSMEYI